MAQDYASKPKHRRSSKSRGNNKRPKFGSWLATIILVAGFVGGLFYLKAHNPLTQTHSTQSKRHSYTLPQKKSNSTAHKGPRFDFYTLLPKMQVGSVPGNTTTAPVAKATPALKPESRYLLQIASFTKATEADRLKAQLLLMGFTVHVRTVNNGKKTWNRVQIGPYPSLNAANKAQQQLQNVAQLKSIVRKVKTA